MTNGSLQTLRSAFITNARGLKSFWKRRWFRYVGVFFVIAAPLVLFSLESTASNNAESHSSPKNNSVQATEDTMMQQEPSQPATNSSSAGISVQTHVHSSSTTGTQNSQSQSGAGTANNSANQATSVQINGKDVPVPDNGQLHKTIVSPDGSVSSVDISTSGDGSSTNSSSSVQVNIDSQSSP